MKHNELKFGMKWREVLCLDLDPEQPTHRVISGMKGGREVIGDADRPGELQRAVRDLHHIGHGQLGLSYIFGQFIVFETSSRALHPTHQIDAYLLARPDL